MNKEGIIAGISMLLRKNYKVNIDEIDLDNEVDSTLSFRENWNNIKDKIIIGCFCPTCGRYR